MELISSAKSTRLTSFETLKSKFVYYHVENEPRDFNFFGNQKLFIEVNKSNGFEMLRVKTEDNESKILKVLRMKHENLYCVASPKQMTDFIALGLSTGQVALLNYRQNKVTAKFSAENPNNGIVFLDFNASDEYLSAVYENGLINLYGLKTKTKLETLNIDKNSTMARFHVDKRFQLSVASYTGAVYVYDMQRKRNIFKTTDSHGAPCRDICTTPAAPDSLFSVGYDCILNIFDMRRKLSPQQIRSNHPLSAVCVSECGRYCCTGNLKGELTSYDLRNLKSNLYSSLVHDSAIVRVAFVPVDEAANVSNLGSPTRSVLTETQNLPPEENSLKSRRDSFFDFINCHVNNRETLGRRESFNLQALEKNHYDFDSPSSVGTRSSIDTRFSMDIKPINGALSNRVEGETSITLGNSKVRRSLPDTMFRDKRSKNKTVDFIEEEVFEEPAKPDESTDCSNLPEKKVAIISNEKIESSKENILNISRKDLSYLMKLPDDKNSTPNPPKRCSSCRTDEIKNESELNYDNMKAILKEIQDIRKDMNDKFKFLETEIKFHADANKSDLYLQNFSLWRNQMNVSEDTRTLLLSLLHADPFVMEFLKLQEENQQLKEKLNIEN